MMNFVKPMAWLCAGVLLCTVFSCENTAKEGLVAQTERPSSSSVGLEQAEDTAQEPVVQTAASDARELYELAWLERSRGFQAGSGRREAAIREAMGDWAGAVLASCKELSWAYSMDLLLAEDLSSRLQALGHLCALENGDSPDAAAYAFNAWDAYQSGSWAAAYQKLLALYPDTRSGDSYVRYLLLSCQLELKTAPASIYQEYSALRARYMSFPEFWLRAAHHAPTVSERQEAAELCVSLAPSGPYAAEARSLLATLAGLDAKDGSSILVKREIESACAMGRWQELWPLLALPDNPWTLYALSLCRQASSEAALKELFRQEAKKASGRLAERLSYVAGA
jgi:hypothetical protein